MKRKRNNGAENRQLMKNAYVWLHLQLAPCHDCHFNNAQHALYEEGWWRKLLQITVIRCVLIDPGGDIGDISEIGNCYYPLFAGIDIRDVEIVSDCLIDWHKAAKTVQIWDCVTLSIKYCDGGDVTNGTSVTMSIHAGVVVSCRYISRNHK